MVNPTSGLSPNLLIEIDGLSKNFNEGRPQSLLALQDVSLSMSPGEFVSILGPSGCGKSTLLMLIAGLYTPTSGQVRNPHSAVLTLYLMKRRGNCAV